MLTYAFCFKILGVELSEGQRQKLKAAQGKWLCKQQFVYACVISVPLC